ncbi:MULTISPECIES: ABC transporter permease [unclassified Brevundimonas]|uniref:cell division protein FtsX n=1 Tax=unclassified Brevundimonas TaxID=2622653 RepID=UPI000CFDB0D9|nr:MULTISPECIES: cell division protein [unclassified Brevundimonas]PRA35269.1 cell division protein [Brevundimonas sp. MYb27]PQZ82983.1 cell division protein [Brevundimonas sp. MYb31]PRB14992.1 cell division protein [Brevundimonas sp. MYb52]PRB36905.1 cell division protein [Brevundimonas sp. MYb46]PRB52211.1 cell division protein [Brevundimonas sp. MYb33]
MIRALFRRGPALLSREAGGERWLMVVVAVLCFLASITAVGAVAADRAAHGWAHQLRGEATVQVRPRVDETGPTAAARAAETLAGVKGVAEAEAMDRKAAEALLRPWVGEAALPDLPLPYLVTVRLDPNNPASAPTLSRALAEAGLDATVDDHSLWRGEVERSAGVITALAGAAFLLIAAATAAVIAYATRAGMAAQANVIETLSLNGASDSYVAGLFQRRFGGLAAQAGALGAGVAALLLALVRLIGGEGGLTPALPLAFSDLAILIACPLLAFGVALLAARFTALAKLGGRG